MGCLFRDYDAVTQASISLTMNSQHLRRLERFTVLMYSKNCESESANEVRKMMCPQALSHSKIYRLYNMYYFSMQSVHCSLPHLMETVSCPKIRKSLNRVNGVGNGITEPWHGYRIGQICQMQAMDARYYFIVVARSHARATVKASEPEFDVVSCPSAMEAVQTILRDRVPRYYNGNDIGLSIWPPGFESEPGPLFYEARSWHWAYPSLHPSGVVHRYQSG